MTKSMILRTGFAPLLMTLIACTSMSPRSSSNAEPPTPEVVGETSRVAVETAVPGWGEDAETEELDGDAVARLADAPPGSTVTVYFGTWCSDSQREVPRLWKALADAAPEGGEGLPFSVRYVGVDRDKEQPADLLAGADLLYVPTVVVRRGPLEVGRIVEEPLISIEHDLAALLHGEAYGVLTQSRPELVDDSDG